jgi:MHS family shikimate/dehydroshikimate transporter-like MFS transporter
MYAPQGSFLAELFDTRVRMTGLSLGKQIGAVLGAGLAPMIATWIIGTTGGTDGVVIYYAIMAGIAFVAALLVKETSKLNLYDNNR